MRSLMLWLFSLLSLVFLAPTPLTAQSAVTADTLVTVFHHNYLIEKHAELTKFAEEIVAYSGIDGVSKTLQDDALRFQQSVADMQVWKSTDVVQTMDSLNHYLSKGIVLRNEILSTVDRTTKYSNGLKPVINTVLIVLGLAFAVLYFISRRND